MLRVSWKMIIFWIHVVSTRLHSNTNATEYPFRAPVHYFEDNTSLEAVLQFRSSQVQKSMLLAITSDDHDDENGNLLLQSLLIAIDFLGADVLQIACLKNRRNDHHINGEDFISLSKEKWALILYDNPINLSSHHEIPYDSWKSTGNLKQFLQRRYTLKVDFISDLPVDLRWAHARGNFRLVSLGHNGSNLRLSSESAVVQYTTAGHLFATLPVELSGVAFPIDRIVSMFFVPATTIELPRINMNANFSCAIAAVYNVYNCAEIRQEKNNCAFILFDYWRKRRQSHIWTQTWLLKELHNGHGSKWHVFNLPSPLYNTILQQYLHSRQQDERKEPIISTVFNQLESPTYHIPINDTLLGELSAAVVVEAANWLSMRKDELIRTGSYGVREYREGAIINWHTDPAETQPITAIIHIGNEMTSNESMTSMNSDWKLELAAVDVNVVLGKCDAQVEYITLRGGQGVVIESARMPHARPHPLKRVWFGNAFVHLAPKYWSSHVEGVLG